MPVLTSQEVRTQFIRFFEERNHRFVPSSPVVPIDDPTLLFTNAGMNQFKPIFLGTERPEHVRVTNSQKCIRVSGKHNDLEEVGHDTYHHTFFEMMGNWSFGDYYKKEAIEWAWELLTREWCLPKDRLYATVYKDDSEAESLWKKVTDIDASHVLRFGEQDNFWEMGDTGPCGPCSEIHIDLTAGGDGAKLVNAGTPDVIELWNLVFIQFNRHADRSLAALPAKHVDTGAGFERLTRVLQGKASNYDIDIFQTIIRGVEQRTGRSYGEAALQPAFRVIADHLRMLTFSITDGAVPGNEGRGYVLRRILRRATMYGRKLQMHEPFVCDLVGHVVNTMGDAFPEIRQRQAYVEKTIRTEEEHFNRTLDRGLEVFEDLVRALNKRGRRKISGDDVFKLYDTFGFPMDLTRVLAAERSLTVDEDGFSDLMAAQRQRSREEGKKKFISRSVDWILVGDQQKSKFLGYDTLESEAAMVKYVREGNQVQLVFDRTPFYPESGGQLGDRGGIRVDGFQLEVWDTQRVGDDIVHFVDAPEDMDLGRVSRAHLGVSREWRNQIIRNHSATHLLHAALRRVLGTHVQQAGSVVEPGRLRFDFTHFEKVSESQIAEIEDIVNAQIRENIPLKHHRDIPFAEAQGMGALSFFGDKYGERVNVVQFGEFSKEFCGGTHVPATGYIGMFRIVGESGVAAGVRRIEAITGSVAQRTVRDERRLVQRLATTLHTHPDGVFRRVEELVDENRELRKAVAALQVASLAEQLAVFVEEAPVVRRFKLVARRVTVPAGVDLKELGDILRTKLVSGVGVLAAVNGDSGTLLCVVTDDLITEEKLHAGNLIKEIAKVVGGSGGGRANLATAGIKDLAHIDRALSHVNKLLK